MEGLKIPKKGKLVKILLIVVTVIVILAIGGVSGYYVTNKYFVKSAEQKAQQETNKLVSAVGKLMALPTDETPSIATVTDKTKLVDQPFFAKSENGDKVLIYTNAKKAILYRPATDKIIEVMPISFSDNSAATTTPNTESQKK